MANNSEMRGSENRKISWLNLGVILCDEESSIKFAQENKLIPNNINRDCINCGAKDKVCLQKRAKQNIPFKLKCQSCKKIVSAATNTWFEGAHVSIKESLGIIYAWLHNLPVEIAASEMDVTSKTVEEYYGFCREVCYVIVTNNSTPIGGPGHIVELDETHLWTRRYNRGQFSYNERKQIWIFGGIERESQKCFVTRVEKRDKDALIPIIKQFILPGTKIITDGWKTYAKLEQEGYIQDLVNHSIELVSDDDPNVHTQNMQRLWKSLKSKIKREGRPTDNDQMYIFQFLYINQQRSDGRKTPSEQFIPFLNDISRVYPGYGQKGLEPVAYTSEMTFETDIKSEMKMEAEEYDMALQYVEIKQEKVENIEERFDNFLGTLQGAAAIKSEYTEEGEINNFVPST